MPVALRPVLLFAVLALSAASARSQPAPDGAPSDSSVTAPDSVRGQERATRLTTASGLLQGYAEPYYRLDALNRGFTAQGEPANLQSPQAALEHFVRAARDERFAEAAAALNLNLIPRERRSEAAPELARHLYYVLESQLGFDWEGLPDRPDGARTQPSGPDDPLLGQPRRSLLVGTLGVDGRDVAVRLQRVRPGEGAPVWVFSPQTVENVPPLYRRFGPGPIDRLLPAWARVEVLGQTALWAWLALLAGIVGVALFAAWVRRFTRRRLEASDSHWVHGAGRRVATPVAFLIGMLALYLFATLALTLPALVTTPLLIVLIGAFVWLAMRAIEYLTEHVAHDQGVESIKDLSTGEGLREQQWLTYLSVGRRVLLFVVFLLGVGLVLSQFESLQALGFSLMASAGVATVILGIAAQPVLGNIAASIQIALTKPVRIGDSVLYEGTWGYIEDITYTYLVIQTWDQRRKIVPLRYFITHPFENWTMRSAHMIKPIYLRADYTLDVDRVRERFDELLREDEDWDEENDPVVQVTAVEDETIEVRALCSAKDPSAAWDLHCRLREALVAFVRDLDEGRYLPRRRIVLAENARTDGAGREHADGATA